MKTVCFTSVLCLLLLVSFPSVGRAQSISPDPCSTIQCLGGLLAGGASGAATCTPAVAQFFAIKIPKNIPLQINLRTAYLNSCPGAAAAGSVINTIIGSFGVPLNPPTF